MDAESFERLDGRNASILSKTAGEVESRYDEIVASLSLLAPTSTGRRILLGARSARNSAHKDVMSLPTLRLPRAAAEVVLAESDYYAHWAEMEDHKHKEHLLLFFSRAIMALKIGLAEWVVGERVNYRCRLGTVLVGNTAIDENIDPPLIQKIAMLNIICELPDMASVPARTIGYSSFKWVEVFDFLEAVRLRDASLASSEWNTIAVCVRGLCVEVGARDVSKFVK